MSWYDVWAAGVVLNGMCIRNGVIGYQNRLGKVESAIDRKAKRPYRAAPAIDRYVDRSRI